MTLVYPVFGKLLALRLSQNSRSLSSSPAGLSPHPNLDLSGLVLSCLPGYPSFSCRHTLSFLRGPLDLFTDHSSPSLFPLPLFNKPQIPFLIWCLSLGCKLNWCRDFFFLIYSQCPEPCLAYNRYFIEISLNSNKFMNI